MITMNFHWGRTLHQGWLSRAKRKRAPNHTRPAFPDLHPAYNLTDTDPEEPMRYSSLVVNGKSYFNEVLLHNKSVANISALHADNDFLKKTGMIRDMLGPATKSQSFTTVVVIASIFLFVTLAVTSALVVFCRKKNTVFAFQKSEQEDYPDYELEELNTDVEYTETDNESDLETSPRRKRSYHRGSHHTSSPDRRPLVDSNDEPGDGPIRSKMPTCQCRHGDQSRGDYQMVVTAVLERQANECDTDECSSLMRDRTPKSQSQQFYGLTNIPPGLLQENTVLKVPFRHPQINITYTDQPPTLTSGTLIQSNKGQQTYQVMLTLDNHPNNFANKNSCSQIDTQSETQAKSVVDCESQDVKLYVDLPDEPEKKVLPEFDQPAAIDLHTKAYSDHAQQQQAICSPQTDDTFDAASFTSFQPRRSMSLKDDICSFAVSSSTTVAIPPGQCRSISQPPTPMADDLQFQAMMQMMAFASGSTTSGHRSGLSSRTSLPSASNFNVTGAERLCSRQRMDRTCSIKSLSRDQYLSLVSLPSPFPTPVSDPPSTRPSNSGHHGNTNNSNSMEPCHCHDIQVSEAATEERTYALTVHPEDNSSDEPD